MIPGEIFTSCAKFQGIVSVNDFRLPIRLQELLQASLCFCEVFVLRGYDWIHWVAKSCTTIANRWMFRDSMFTGTFVISAVIKSPKFSARGTAPPMRLLHGALVISVLWQITQFRSSGNWVSTLCLPKSSLLLDVGSKDISWEELACESLCSGTLSSTRFSLNSSSHSRISELNGDGLAANNGSPRSLVVSSSLGFEIFGWLGSARDWFHGKKRVSPFHHLFNIWTWYKQWRWIDSTLILFFSSLTVPWCCRSWWRRT